MAIPNENIIKDIILKHLYTKKENNFSINSQDMYKELIEEGWYGTEDLTEQEINEPYRNSFSEWANKVQWAVKHLKDENLLLDTKDSGRGIWKLSEKGIIEARNRWKEINDGKDIYDNELAMSIDNDLSEFEEEINITHKEGTLKPILSSRYERNSELRKETINIHGLICQVCDFDFSQTYGELGKDYIEVHHLIPISNFNSEHHVNPKTEMAVLCANCHRMMHRNRSKIITVNELKEILENNKK